MQADKRDFISGMEHGNSFPGKEGERALIDAYVRRGRLLREFSGAISYQQLGRELTTEN